LYLIAKKVALKRWNYCELFLPVNTE